MVRRGRPKKDKSTVDMDINVLDLIASRFVYKKRHDFLDDLAMGIIPPTTIPDASVRVTPVVGNVGGSTEVSQPKPDGISPKKHESWADEVEKTESGKMEEKGVLIDSKLNSVDNPPILPVQETEIVKEKLIAPTLSWADITTGNCSYGNGMSLEYFKSRMEVKITDDEWEEGAKLWKFAAVAKIINARPAYAKVLKWVAVNWKSNAPKVSQLKPGLFLFEFNSEEQRLDAMMKNWTFYHKFPVVFKPWNIDDPFDSASTDTTPVWIQLPGLPAMLWPTRNLGKVASFVGKPLATDRMTAQRTKLVYARVLVDVNPSGILPKEILIGGPKGVIKQRVIYEWRTIKCSTCDFLGHEKGNCRRTQATKVSTPIKPSIPVIKDPIVPVAVVNEVVGIPQSILEDPSPSKASQSVKVVVGQSSTKQQQVKNNQKMHNGGQRSRAQETADTREKF